MKRNIVITGGAGFIGSNFVFHMLNKYPEYRIVCLDKLTYAGNLSTLKNIMNNPNFRFVRADICDRDAVYKLFEEEHPNMVVNFAVEQEEKGADILDINLGMGGIDENDMLIKTMYEVMGVSHLPLSPVAKTRTVSL